MCSGKMAKELAMHQLGCIFPERNENKDANAAIENGQVYSLVGVARTKY